MSDPQRLEWEGDQLVLRGYDDWREPICPDCSEPIQWVLDMVTFSVKRGDGHVLVHARCGWKPEAFRKQGRASAALHAPPVPVGSHDAGRQMR